MKIILTLTRHFFDRLFQNDIVSFEEQMTGRIIAVMAILSVYFGFVAFWLTGHYTIFPDPFSGIFCCFFFHSLLFCRLYRSFICHSGRKTV